ncbi:hypothetical protein CMI40_01555 [Candidatus Pacearchaeota archaeon]|jgi:hypothetical protein|nr:hypothetical protein [Candidatus Pacearchaeota archaeon]|tara:strand:- start:1724 stop:2020 length:297 start_codon:yes stop_codon:yes gene_type:complete
MSKISKEKREKIMSNIVAVLYEHSPRALFTSDISKIQARDEEFIKKLLLELKDKKLIIEVKKNPKGISYKRRSRWKLSDATYVIYKNHQSAENLVKSI